MKKALLGILILSAVAFLTAQPSNYLFTSSAGNYTPITGGTVVHSTGVDDALSGAITLPFTFQYCGTAYTSVKISSNGYINVGASMTSDVHLNALGSTAYLPLLAPFWEDLKTNSTTGSVSYLTVGDAPNRQFIIQYTDMLWYYNNTTNNLVNFQCILNENNSSFQYVYGAMGTNPGENTYLGASIGFNCSPGGTGNFMSVTPGNPPATDMSTANDLVVAAGVALLTSGTTYSFGLTATPPPGNPTNPFPANNAVNVTPDGVTLTWDYGMESMTYDLSFGPVDNMTQVVSNADCTGQTSGSYATGALTASTTYQWQITVHNTYGRYTTTGPIWSFSTAFDGVSVFPYQDGFEASVPPPGWTVMMLADPGTDPTWTQVSTGGSPDCSPHGGGFMAKYNSFSAADGAELRLQSRALNFQAGGVATPQISLWMIHDTGYNTYLQEGIRIQYSTDGQTWSDIGDPIYRYDAAFTTPGWVQHTVILGALSGLNNVYVGIVGYSQYGNNIYIDDIELGAAPTQPVFHAAPSDPVVFPQIMAGQTSAPVTYTISNIGGGDLVLSTVTLAGSMPDQFTLTDANNYPATIGAGASLTFSVSFSPTTEGDKNAQVQITDNRSRLAHLLDISGNAYGDQTIVQFPYEQGFEAETFPPLGWTITTVADPGTDPVFTRVTTGGSPACTPHNGSTAMVKYNSFSASDGAELRLVLPPVNFLTAGAFNPLFSLWMIHDDGYDTYLDEGVYIQVSTDGENWTSIGDLIPRYDAAYETPGWEQHTVNLSEYQTADGVLIGVLAHSQFGNNIYLDDFMLTAEVQTVSPATPVNPLNGAVNVPVSLTLSWQAGAGDTPDNYRLYFGDDGNGQTPPSSVINGDNLGMVNTFQIQLTLTHNHTYYWQVVPSLGGAYALNCPIWSFTTAPEAGTTDPNAPVPYFGLQSNQPNPFNPSTVIRYSLGSDGPAKLVIYNLRGEPVKTLVDSNRKAGFYRVTWNGDDDAGRPVGSGIYLYRLQSGDKIVSRKATMLK
jgi:hypothetical protein